MSGLLYFLSVTCVGLYATGEPWAANGLTDAIITALWALYFKEK